MRPGACAEGLLRHAGLQAGGAADGAAGRRRRDALPHRRHAARASASGGVAGVDRAGCGPRRGDLGADPGGPSARHRRVPAGAFRQFLAGASGGDARLGAGAWRRIGARICPATTPSSAACASPTRNAATTPKPRKPAAPPSRAIPAICGRRTAWRMSWRCRAAAARAWLWLELLAPHWEGSNNLRHHLWWHAAMFQLERGDQRAVLALYDGSSAISPRRWWRRCPTSTSTCRTPPRCCGGWRGTASMSATAGPSWPTRRRRASATACPRSRCRTG